jgi:hypothetical protein
MGIALDILSKWAIIDRHRRLNLVGTAISKGQVRFRLPDAGGMSIESWDYEVGKHLLENDTETAQFRVKNFVPGTEVHADVEFALEVLVNETPGMCKLQDAALTMGLSVSVVRESFERHYGIQRPCQFHLSAVMVHFDFSKSRMLPSFELKLKTLVQVTAVVLGLSKDALKSWVQLEQIVRCLAFSWSFGATAL